MTDQAGQFPPLPLHRHYIGKVAAKHCVEAARKAGIEPGALEFLPDGTLRVIDRDVAEIREALQLIVQGKVDKSS